MILRLQYHQVHGCGPLVGRFSRNIGYVLEFIFKIADVTDEDYGPGEGYDNEIAGISSVFVSNGYCETINFKGTGFTNTKVGHIQLFMITI
jgi:hypothetical protein